MATKMDMPVMVEKLEEIENEGLREFAIDQVEEATRLGLVFKGYVYIANGQDEIYEGGVHLFKYEWDRDLPPTDEEMEALRTWLTQDDDSQPHANFSWYFGDVWQMVPYYC